MKQDIKNTKHKKTKQVSMGVGGVWGAEQREQVSNGGGNSWDNLWNYGFRKKRREKNLRLKTAGRQQLRENDGCQFFFILSNPRKIERKKNGGKY